MLSTLTLPGTFWFYSAVAFTGCIVFYFVLPETEGRTLLEIEEHFLGKKSLSEEKPKSNHLENGVNENQKNGFDLVTVGLQIPSKTPTLQINGTMDSNSNTITLNENHSEHRLSIPESFISAERQPRAGSKRYKHRVSDINRRASCTSRNSVTSNDEIHDTHL